jgi:hypothetical protein
MKRRRRSDKRRIRLVLLVELLLGLVICASAYGLTASVTLHTIAAGDAATSTPQVHVATMYFNLNLNDPRIIDSVVLTFTPAATPIANLRVSMAGSAWSNSCSGGPTWTCSWASSPSMTSFSSDHTIRVQVHS